MYLYCIHVRTRTAFRQIEENIYTSDQLNVYCKRRELIAGMHAYEAQPTQSVTVCRICRGCQ